MGKADIHIHTTASDGLLDPRDVVEYVATETDLNVIAITDHDTLAGAHKAWQWLQAHPQFPLQLLWGVEMTGAWFKHLLFYWPDRPPARLPRRLTAPARLMRELRETGALCVAAHPANPFSMAGPDLRSLVMQGLSPDGLEACNPAAGRRPEKRLRKLAHELGLAVTGGSDTHGVLATIGAAYTAFPGSTREDFIRALLTGATDAGWSPPIRIPIATIARQIVQAWFVRPGLLQRTR